jgi:hypothetical protein
MPKHIKLPNGEYACKSKEYKSWAMMKSRCNNKKDSNYHNYGARGIKVCDRWKTFIKFYEDMGERPADTTLDRIDVNGNYEPGNCQWSDQQSQRRNQRLFQRNKSGFLGVSLYKRSKKWVSYIQVGKDHYNLGYYNDPQNAAIAYDCAQIQLVGEKATFNFI